MRSGERIYSVATATEGKPSGLKAMDLCLEAALRLLRTGLQTEYVQRKLGSDASAKPSTKDAIKLFVAFTPPGSPSTDTMSFVIASLNGGRPKKRTPWLRRTRC
jgi:hypothetical protein